MKFMHLCAKFIVLTSVCALHSQPIWANNRLDAVQSTYLTSVDGFVLDEVKGILTAYSKLLTEVGADTLNKLSARASDVEKKIVVALESATNTTDYKTFLVEQRRIMQALGEIADSEAFAEIDSNYLKQRLEHLNQSELCTTSIPNLMNSRTPHYDVDEKIDTSFIPPPKQYGIRLSVGSEIESADKLEKGMFMPSTTAGCIVGQVFIPLPFLGCIIGAAGAATDSYIRGKIITGVITLMENHKERVAHEEAVEAETMRQRQEIAQAKTWAEQHPISSELIFSRGARYCLAQPLDFQDNFIRESEAWLEAIKKAKSTLIQQADLVKQAGQELRETTLNQARQDNAKLVTKRIFSVPKNELDSRDPVETINSLKRAFSVCLLGEDTSCQAMASCVDEFRVELEAFCALKEECREMPAFLSFEREIAQIENDLTACNDSGEQE